VKQGEHWISGTSKRVADLAACKKSCDDDAECQSITFYGQDKFCSHFSTKCENRRKVPNAHAEKLKDFKTTPKPSDVLHEECDVLQGEIYVHKNSGIEDSYAACKQSCMDDIMCESITFYNHGWCSHFSTQCTKRKLVPNAVAVATLKKSFANNQECDQAQGEDYLRDSSSQKSTHEACHKSCKDTKGCQSATFFRSGWCSHYSTCCKKTKFAAAADVMRLSCFIPNNQVCNVDKGEVYLKSVKVATFDYAACKKKCEDNTRCLSVTYYQSHGGCDLFATCCKETKPSQGAHGALVKKCEAPDRYNNEVCDVAQGETYYKKVTGQKTYEDCKKSCTGGCVSVVHYEHTGVCDQFSTCCKKTKKVGGANGGRVNKCPEKNNMACDNGKGEKWESTRKTDTLAKCVKSCEDRVQCKGLTYYAHGGCDHYSTCCKNKKPEPGAHAQTVKGYGICTPTTTTTTTNPCLTSNGGCSSQRTCQYSNGKKTCGPCPTGYHALGATKCEKDNPCDKNNGGCSSQRKCTNTNGKASCGPCPTGYHADGTTKCKKDDPCKKNNGGCSSQRTCTNNNFVATCGPCPKGYHAKGKACEKDTTTTTPQPNCVFCERAPPIAFMLDRSGSMAWCGRAPHVNKHCRSPNRRFDKVVREVIKMLATMPDGTLFSVQTFSQSILQFNGNKYAANSASMRNTLNTWFHGTSRPGGGTYMTTGLNYLLQKKGTAKTLYLLADGETAQGQATLVNAGKSGGVPIHVVGVDLRTQDGGYKNLHALKVATGGTEKYI